MSTTDNVLLSLLLTLPELDSPLDESEKESLNNVGLNLRMPEANHSNIDRELLDIVQKNPVWNQQFTEIKAYLDDLGGEIAQEILPTLEELKQVLPPSNAPIARGPKPKGYSGDDRIYNTAVNIFTTPDPPQTAKTIRERFGRLTRKK